MNLERITKILLFSTLFIPLFVVANFLLFPYISGKVYLFRFLVEVSFLFWLVLIIKKPRYRPNFKNPIIITTLLILAGLIITGFLGADPIRSFFSDLERGKGVIQFAHWALYLIMLTSVCRERKDRRNFLLFFLISAILISLWAWGKGQGSLYGTFGNPAYLGGFIVFALGFLFLSLERNYFEFLRKKSLILSAVLGAALFLGISLVYTGIRGALAGLGAALIFFTLFSLLFFWRRNKKLIIILIFVLLAGGSILLISHAYQDSSFVKENKFLKNSSEVFGAWQTDSFKQRAYTWQIALKSFKERPLFGWGMENFQMPFNKYYDYRIGLDEPWFDRVHNQTLQYLVDGGILLFSLYLLWIFAFFYSAFKIFRKNNLLGLILPSIFIGYLAQGFFLFDTFPIYAGLFTLLFFASVKYDSFYGNEPKEERKKEKNLFWKEKFVLILVLSGILCSIYFGILLPYRANKYFLDFHVAILENRFGDAKQSLSKSFNIESPYTYFSVRNQAGWEFMQLLNQVDIKKTKENNPQAVKNIENLYDFVVPELERALDSHPADTQIYYVLGKTYRLGFEKLGKNSLKRAEEILKRARKISARRLEYFDELSRVLILEEKYDETEEVTKDYVRIMDPEDPFFQVVLGHLYFVEEKYNLAMEHYEEAKNKGYDFTEKEGEYNRYLSSAEKLKEYQKVADMCHKYLDKYGPDSATFFNLAVAYRDLEEALKAKEYFKKAVDQDNKYEKFRSYFDGL